VQRITLVTQKLPADSTGPVDAPRYVETWLEAHAAFAHASGTPTVWEQGRFYREDVVTKAQPERWVVMLLATRNGLFYRCQLETNSQSQADELLSNMHLTIPDDTAHQTVRVEEKESHALILKTMPPVYPPDARLARIQGSVLLGLEVTADGRVVNVHVVRGHPMLVDSALNAVKQWRFKPYTVNGQPVNMQTSVTINFTLAGR